MWVGGRWLLSNSFSANELPDDVMDKHGLLDSYVQVIQVFRCYLLLLIFSNVNYVFCKANCHCNAVPLCDCSWRPSPTTCPFRRFAKKRDGPCLLHLRVCSWLATSIHGARRFCCNMRCEGNMTRFIIHSPYYHINHCSFG